ncbi:MAG: TerC family protein [Planctomycetes bacterium]|nr:TerC family protein [Planctomycetota bacterium]
MWSSFAVLVTAMLALDLGVLNRKAHVPSLREAALVSLFYVALAFGFNGWVWYELGATSGLDFMTGYLLEKALSVDNLFVFLVLFRSLGVPPQHQHRVLFWGILGALVTRGVFIWLGAALVERFDWIFYVFGAVLVFTGIKLMVTAEVEPHPERNAIVRLLTRLMPITAGYRGAAFVVLENGRRFGTPLLVALVAAEATDIVFAVDSIPAIFGITSDPFIVYTSNIFAILGLRALYFLLAGIIERFHYLKTGLALVLLYIGAKMVVGEAFDLHVPTLWSLLVLLVLVGGSVVLSLLRPVPPAEP